MFGALLLACASPDRPPALIVVALDNVRWDRTTLSGSAHGRTPALAELAALPGAVTFPHAYSSAPFSLASYASLFTSRPVPDHQVGVTSWTLPESASTLAEAFRDNGWKTAAFTGGAEIARGTGLDQGFDTFVDGDLSPLSVQLTSAIPWLREAAKGDQPFFLFVHGYDAHIPYRAPRVLAESYDPDYRGIVHLKPGLFTMRGLGKLQDHLWPDPTGDVALTDADLAHIAAHYDASVRVADYSLGRLLREIDDLDLLDRATIVVLADHGEELGEYGAFRHGPYVVEESVHVPLVIRSPHDKRPARRWDGVVSLLDLGPTLLDRFGIAPLGEARGRPIPMEEAPRPGRVATTASGCCFGVRDADWLLVDEGGKVTLRRDGTGDDHLADEPEVAARLEAVVGDWQPTPDPHLPEPTGELAKKLHEAGYWTPTGAPPQPPPQETRR